ncbi:hypothetical protein T265_14107, partial [Opisthorchis viverrini]
DTNYCIFSDQNTEAETTTEKSQKTESTGAAKISESSRTAQQTKSTSTAKISEPSGTA